MLHRQARDDETRGLIIEKAIAVLILLERESELNSTDC